jgi:beta-lactamase class A
MRSKVYTLRNQSRKGKPNMFVTKFALPISFAVIILTIAGNAPAQDSKKKSEFKPSGIPFVANDSAALQTILTNAINETIADLSSKGFKAENIAATLIDLRDPQNLARANFRGEEKIYPASVVKMFYLAALHRWLEDGKIKDSPELRRGMKDMIVESYNDATQYIVDVLTDTSSGAELSPKELGKFAWKRNIVNRYFESLGFENINVCQKTYCEDAYGREQQFRDGGKNRNKLTTNATARLLTEIVLRRVVSADRSNQMLELMKRDFESRAVDPEDQAHGFTGIALKPGTKLWSKAGWTSDTRHDAAYVETPEGLKFVIVIFTEHFANEREIIPGVVRKVMANFPAR